MVDSSAARSAGRSKRRVWRGDDLQIEIGETTAGGDADTVESLTHDVQRIFGGIQ